MAAIEILTFNDILTDLAEKLGETKINSTDSRKRAVNNALNYICNEELWWFLEDNDTATTTDGSLSFTLPTDFRAFHPLNPLKLDTTWYTQIPFKNLRQYDGTNGTVRLPQYTNKKTFYVYGLKWFVTASTLTSGQAATLYYYKKAVTLEATSDTPIIPAEWREMISLLAAGNLMKAQGGRESVEGNDYLELYDQFLGKMRTENEKRREWGIKRRVLDPEEQQSHDL